MMLYILLTHIYDVKYVFLELPVSSEQIEATLNKNSCLISDKPSRVKDVVFIGLDLKC